MALAQDEVDTALRRIKSAGLPHPSAPLLSAFVHNALHPQLAARYVNTALAANESELLVSDWTYIVECFTVNSTPPPPLDSVTRKQIAKRDGNKCCVTGKPGHLWDPLIVAPILPVPFGWIADKPRIFDMLGAFFGPPYRDWWLSYIKAPARISPYFSHWLVRRSASQAIARGLVSLERRQPSMIEYKIEHLIAGTEDPIEVAGSYPLLGDIHGPVSRR